MYFYYFRKQKHHQNIGDLSEDDLDTPRRRNLFWKSYIRMSETKNKRKSDYMSKIIRSLESKINSLNALNQFV